MKILTYIYVSLFICALTGGIAQAQQGQFFDTLYDIPLMKGMEELPEMAMSFDKPNGRIAEAGAVVSEVSPQVIIEFYQVALSQMGWEKKAHDGGSVRFIRESEELSLFIEKTGTSTLVRFLLQPAEGS